MIHYDRPALPDYGARCGHITDQCRRHWDVAHAPPNHDLSATGWKADQLNRRIATANLDLLNLMHCRPVVTYPRLARLSNGSDEQDERLREQDRSRTDAHLTF